MIVKEIKNDHVYIIKNFKTPTFIFVINSIIFYIINVLYNPLIPVAYFRDNPAVFPM